VIIILTGPAAEDARTFADSFDDLAIETTAGLSNAQVTATHVETEAAATVDLSVLAGSSGAKELSFGSLGLTLALSSTSVTATPNEGFAGQVSLTSTATGLAETISVNETPRSDGSQRLQFERLGVAIAIGPDSAADLEGTLAALQGSRAGGGQRRGWLHGGPVR
jgi:hypothetical protein